MAELEGIYTIWLRETKRYIRYKSRIVTSVVTPLLWLTILFTSVFSGVSVIIDRQYGFLKEILVAPIMRSSVVMGKALGISTASLIQGVILLLLSFIVGIRMTIPCFLLSTAIIVLTSLGLAGLGLMIASFTDSMEGFNLILSFIVLPMFLLSGALFPITGLPEWLQFAVYLNPLTYGVDALRFTILKSSVLPLYINFIVLIGFSAATVLTSAYLFSKREQGLM